MHTWMTLCGQQNSLCFIPVFQSSNMRIKVLSESLHTTARKTTFSLTAIFTLIFSQTWVRRGLPRNYKGIKFFLSCSKIGVVYLIYLLSQGQWISIFPIILQFISKQSDGFQIRERLDRALGSSDWPVLFPRASLHHLSSSVSDHSPLSLHLKSWPCKRGKRRLFRFESMWLKDARCEEIVKEAWEEGELVG